MGARPGGVQGRQADGEHPHSWVGGSSGSDALWILEPQIPRSSQPRCWSSKEPPAQQRSPPCPQDPRGGQRSRGRTGCPGHPGWWPPLPSLPRRPDHELSAWSPLPTNEAPHHVARPCLVPHGYRALLYLAFQGDPLPPSCSPQVGPLTFRGGSPNGPRWPPGPRPTSCCPFLVSGVGCPVGCPMPPPPTS